MDTLHTGTFAMRQWMYGLFGLAVWGLLSTAPVAAQSGAGAVTRAGWPEDLQRTRSDFATDQQLLPRLDTLSLQYRYASGQSGAQMSFVLAWRPGAQALYRGDVVPYERLPPDVRMVAVELQAEVLVDGQAVADILVAVDSMALRPHPSVYAFEVADIAYESVFLDTPADSARAYFERGFTLRNLTVQRIGFAPMQAIAEAPPERQRPPTDERTERRPPPSHWSVYAPRVNILVGWRLGPDRYYIGPRGDRRAVQPRTDAEGRSGTEDSSRGDPSGRTNPTAGNDDSGDASTGGGRTTGRGEQTPRGSDDDDDDDDDDTLVPASVVALGAVGLAAIVGGSVGYYGTGHTPLGLMAGGVTPRGGGLLQAGINSAVLGQGNDPQQLTVKGLGFYDVFDAPVQPAVGLGAVATAIDDDTVVDPSLTLGFVGNLGRVVVMGGYDVIEQTPEFGLAINFKFSPDQ